MRWFKHFANARHNPKFRAIEKKLGEAGYARAIKLFEIVAERGGTGKEFRPVLDLRKPPTDLDWLAEEWKISNEDAIKTLDLLAEVRITDSKSWRKKIVEVPQMLEYRDEWAERQRHGSNSMTTTEQLPSHSGATPSRSRVEAEIEVEADCKKNPAAATSLKDPDRKVLKQAWDAIGVEPLGAHPICGVWEFFYTEFAKKEPLSAVMERAILHCRRSRLRVPPPFFTAKRRIEEKESNEEGRLPRLVVPD